MKGFFAAFIGSFTILFLAAWGLAGFYYDKIATAEYQITKAHENFIAACNLGDIDIIGDSTANADLIPSRIGAGLRMLGLGGGTPVEIYYEIKSILHCKNRPKAVIFEYVPSSFTDDPAFPAPQKTHFWDKAFAFGVVNRRDAMEVSRYSKRFDTLLFTGPVSVFNLDFRIRANLYAVGFPSYFLPDIQHYIIEFLLGRNAADRALNLLLYNQTIADDGHHFYGTQPAGDADFDQDAGRADYRISALTDFYFRQSIETLTRNGIKVFLLEPPRQVTSFRHYPPGLADIYQRYLLQLQSSEPAIRLIGNGFQVWEPELFGDYSHLNLRGSLIFSAQIRDALGAAALPESENLYAAATADPGFWTSPAIEPTPILTPASGTVLPSLADPAPIMVWRYHVPALARGIAAKPVVLASNSHYAVSIMVKNIDTDAASVAIHWPAFNGKLTWNFLRRAVLYSGDANALNAGVSLCPDGWIELFLSLDTGPARSYPGPVISLSATHAAAADLYNPVLERGMWPANYCTLQPGESKPISLETEKNRVMN